jgi:hypothetical protein
VPRSRAYATTSAGIPTRRLSWPTVVLAGGVLLSLAANLAQAQPTAWGRIVAAVPPAAFLVAVSMIERRAARRPRPLAAGDGGIAEPSAPGRPSPLSDAGDEAQNDGDEALLIAARRAAAEHQDRHGQPPASSPHLPSLVRGGQAGGRGRGAGVGSTGTAKAWQPTGTSSSARSPKTSAGRPARSATP